jgi:hypothetical protein
MAPTAKILPLGYGKIQTFRHNLALFLPKNEYFWQNYFWDPSAMAVGHFWDPLGMEISHYETL